MSAARLLLRINKTTMLNKPIVKKRNFFLVKRFFQKKEQMRSGDHLGEVVLRVSCCRLPPARARARHDAGLGDFGSILTRLLVPEPKMEVDLVSPILLPPAATAGKSQFQRIITELPT